ncbi:gustatory receptor 47 [Tribolium castaneum]|uniref:Gustatory receptor n=1 Tax=Tribolium castaneum TaxID=7070 RepID=A2AX95_TRICA|nr:gustatory receptor [Tribolium castaneum]EFA05772.1 gustatory receptor 47 [Tribolium castaneum]CAL23166.1 gustatory receptor candidate 33 [Tribolium castaneum]
MDLEVLEIYFTVANKFSGKLWPISIVLIYTVGVVYSFKRRIFYQDESPISRLVYIGTDLSYFISNVYQILAYNFWKKKYWSEFLANLKLLKGRKIRKNLYYLLLFVINVLYVLTLCYAVYYWRQQYEDFWHRYTLSFIENYCQFLYNCFHSTLLLMILSRYQRLKAQLWQNRYETVAHGMTVQKTTLFFFNRTFGVPIFLVLVFVQMQSVQDLSDIFYYKDTAQLVSLALLMQLTQLVPALFVIYLCGRVMEEQNKIRLITFEMNKSFERDKNKLGDFVALIRDAQVKITAADFFILDKSTILKVLDTVVAFLMVVAQFQD